MRHDLEGVIASAGFTSGHRVVIGNWSSSPLGPMVDVMWCDPDGHRTLFAPDDEVAGFVGAIYAFEEVVVAPFDFQGNGWALRLELGDRMVELVAGPGWEAPVRRPPWFTRFVEAPVAWVTMGVRPYGTSPTGIREWYRADACRPVQCGHGRLGGASLGRLAHTVAPTGFGFSEPPRRPSFVAVRPLLHDPEGRLDELVAFRAHRPHSAVHASTGKTAPATTGQEAGDER